MTIPRTRGEASAMLGVAHDAGPTIVNDRHRRLAQLFHPDVNPGVGSAGLRMQEINAARELLLGEDATPATAIDPTPARGARPRERSTALSPEARAREQRIGRTMHELPYGVYVLGTVRDGDPNVMVADWVMQVSHKPRLVVAAFEQDATSLANIRASRVFTVNLLAQDNGINLASAFLQPKDGSKIGGRSGDAAAIRDKLDGVDYDTTPDGCPILRETHAWCACEAEEFFAVGDHVLVTARVIDGALLGEGEPLTSVYTGWTYGG